jgi:hypothetical protein
MQHADQPGERGDEGSERTDRLQQTQPAASLLAAHTLRGES